MDAIVRPARQSDKGPLMSFIKDVWGGHDYIPHVWDRWISDRRNRMFVVEAGGLPVGMNRIRYLQDGTAWFEAARIHPKYRGFGLAALLAQNSMRVAIEDGCRRFRLTSSSRNRPAHRHIARIGFKEVARYSVYQASAVATLPSSIQRAQRVDSDHLSDTMSAIVASAEFRLGAGFFWHDFAAATLGPDALQNLVRRGCVWKVGGSIAVAQKGGEGKEPWGEVGFIGGPPKEGMTLIEEVLGRVRGVRRRLVFVPQKSPMIRAMREAGFQRNLSNILFEREAAKG